MDTLPSNHCDHCGAKSGVAFATKNGLLPSMSEDSKPLSDKIITLRFPFVDNRYLTLIDAYTPAMTNSSNKLSSFYDQHDQIFLAIPNANEIVLFELVIHIIPGQRFLVNLERRRQSVAVHLHRTPPGQYQDQLQIQANPQNLLNALKIKTLAPYRLHHHATA